MTRERALLLVLTAIAPLLLLGCSSAGGRAATGAGRIAFTSNRDGDWEIYVMNADGTAQTRITHLPGMDTGPVWSPDGTRIAFSSNSNGGDVYVMNADGSDLTRLTSDPANDGGPTWSPDGKRIAFSSNRDGNYQVYVMNADGSGQIRLTNEAIDEAAPQWSPDGRRIAFFATHNLPFPEPDDNDTLSVMNVDGSGRTRLASAAAISRFSWSSDGTRLVFSAVAHAEQPPNWDLFVVKAYGSELTKVGSNLGRDGEPAWSPDGRRIVFVSSAGISTISADGSRLARLVDSLQAKVFRPAWSPDGRHITLDVQDENSVAIYVLDADGSNLARLTDQPTDDFDPIWAPAP